MHLENIVIDAVDPSRAGRFWQQALGTQQLTDSPEGFETRLQLGGGAFLDLCFPRVPERPAGPQRLHLDLYGGGDEAAREQIVQRLRGLGAADLDIGQGDVPWTVMADLEEVPFCVLEHRPEQTATGPIAALPLDVADPDASRDFWAALTGWVDVPGSAPRTLRHPSLVGPALEMCPELAPKGPHKNGIHLDIRLDAGDDADEVAAMIIGRGGAEVLDHGWGELPWRVFTDPSGNELCVLPAAASGA